MLELGGRELLIWLAALIDGEGSVMFTRLEALIVKGKLAPGQVGFLPQHRDILIDRLQQIYVTVRSLNTRGRVVTC